MKHCFGWERKKKRGGGIPIIQCFFEHKHILITAGGISINMTEKPDRTIFLSKNQILRCENKDICEMVEKTAQKAIIQGYMSSN